MSLFSQVLIKLFSLSPPLFMFHDVLFQRLLIVSEIPEVFEHIRVILTQLHYLLIPLSHHGVLLPHCGRQLLHLYLQVLLRALLIHLLLCQEGQSLLHLVGLGAAHIKLLLEDSYQVFLLVTVIL